MMKIKINKALVKLFEESNDLNDSTVSVSVWI